MSDGGGGTEAGTPRSRGGGPMLWVVVGVVVFSVVGFFALAGFALFSFRDSLVLPSRVPEVAGLPADEAGRTLREEGFGVRREPGRGTVEQAGRVVGQEPAAGSFRREGARITISVGALEVVPDLTSSDRGNAADRLPERLRVTTRRVEASDEPAGTIVSQEPAAGERVPWDTAVAVVVSGGRPEDPGGLLDEDFSGERASNNAGGWNLGRDENGGVEYVDGSLYLYSAPGSRYVVQSFADAAGSVGDAVLEVEAETADAPPGERFVSYWGLACRTAPDSPAGYRMLISGSGYAQILKYSESGSSTVLSEGTFGTWIPGESGRNRLRADCVEDKLSFYVNGRRLLTATDDEYAEGLAGLYTSYVSEEPPGITVSFDDFRLSPPAGV